MAIEGLRKCQRRHPKGCYFVELTPERRKIAWLWLEKFLARARARGKPITPQRLGGMVARATSLSGMAVEQRSAWGRSMLAKLGGYAVQRRYRARGIDPTRKATWVRLAKGGCSESARRFLNGQSREESEQPAAPVECHESQVPNPVRPGAPPLTVTVGRPTGNVPGFWRRARVEADPIP